MVTLNDKTYLFDFRHWSGRRTDEGEFFGETYGLALHDVNGDGFLDFYANHHWETPPELVLGLASGAPQSQRIFTAADQHGAVFFDIDQDGDADLLEAVGGGRGGVSDPTATKFWNIVLINSGGTFSAENHADDFGVSYGPSRSRILVPLNVDGQLALFNGSVPKDDGSYPATFLRMRGDGDFQTWSPLGASVEGDFAISAHLGRDDRSDILVVDRTKLYLHENTGSGLAEARLAAMNMGRITDLAVADFDGDLDQEIFLGQAWGLRDKILERGGDGIWRDTANAAGLHAEKTKTVSATTGDFDNDGDIDIAALQDADGVSIIFWENDGAGRFSASLYRDVGVEGVGQHIVSGDFDRDGMLDFLITTGGGTTGPYPGEYIYLESVRNGNNWLSIGLEGTRSETSGLGARVFVTTPDGKVQMLEQDSGAHRFGQDSQDLHFGLGRHTEADIRIVWPDGFEQRVEDVAVNRHLVLREARGEGPGGPPPAPPEPPAPTYPGLLTIDRDGNTVTVTATSRDKSAAFDGSLSVEGYGFSDLQVQSFERNDSASLSPGLIDFDLRVFAAPGNFDRFSFRLDPAAEIAVAGAFDVLFTGDPGDPPPPPPPEPPEPPAQNYAGLLTIARNGDAVTVTATSRDKSAAFDGSLAAAGFEFTDLARRSFEGNDSASLSPDRIDFDLRVFAAPGNFDEFSFRLDPAAEITASGAFDVVFV